MDFDAFSLKKRCLPVGAARVAYYEVGTGDPVVFFHGCPFSSYIWRKIIPRFSSRYRCLAPNLLGLGDTETTARADWALHAQEAMVLGWLDALEGLRHFDHPTLLLWGEDDPHFGPAWAGRLRQDIPGAVRLEFLPHTGHLLMEEQPEAFAAYLLSFLSAAVSELQRPAAGT